MRWEQVMEEIARTMFELRIGRYSFCTIVAAIFNESIIVIMP